MTKNKYLFTGLVLAILGVFIFMGYVYYDSRPEGQGSPKAATSSSDNNVTKTQEPFSHPDVTTSYPLTKTTSSIVNKTAIKQDYQPGETERLFYRAVIESFKPKQISRNEMDLYWIRWIRETYRAFPPREPTCYGETKQYNDSVSHSKQYYQEMIMHIQELIKQYPDSPYYPDYQETIELIRQMRKEDESFYDKYDVKEPNSSLVLPDVNYRGDGGNLSTVPLNEKINAYIHCLRYSYFYKLNGLYTMEFGLGDGMQIVMFPNQQPILSGAKLVNAGVPAVPAVLKILEDRRPIIAVDEDKIPSRFYRYQDAAVEILQRMFIKSGRLFPLELHEDQYFSEYMEKQTPEDKQKIINNIKDWVTECMKNPAKPEEQTPSGTDGRK